MITLNPTPTPHQTGSDVAGLKATAERQGDHYVLNGQKKWITWAVHADVSDRSKARQDNTRQDKTTQDKTR